MSYMSSMSAMSSVSAMSAMSVQNTTKKMIDYCIQNRDFLQKSCRVHNEIKLLHLKTIKEREDEYVRRMTDVPEYQEPIKMKSPTVDFFDESENVSRISFCSFKKKGASDV